MVIRMNRSAVGWLLAAVAAVALAATVSGGAGASYKAKSYPRGSTLITSGTQWGNIAGMNPYVGNYAAGMVGLVNETLLRYDPLKDTYINWLATSAKWTGAEAVHGRRPAPASSGPTASRSRAATSRSTSTSAASTPPSGTTSG